MLNLYSIFIVIAFLSQEGESPGNSIPPAFPAWRQDSGVANTVPEKAPVAAPPGVEIPPRAREYSRPESPPGSAAWLLHRMAATDSPALRQRAAEAWPISEEDEKPLQAILRGLSDPAETVRAGAQQRLSEVRSSVIFAYVMRTMTAGASEEVKALDSALPSLGNILDTFLMETLRTELETPEHKRIAAWCLGRTKVLEAAPLLFELAWNSDPELAKTALDALVTLMPPGTTPQWLPLLDHPDPYFKAHAVRALAILREPGSFEKLRLISLGQLEPELQMTALRALSTYPDDTLVPLLVEIMEANRGLAAYALQLLRQRTNIDLGNHPGAWREWLDTMAASPSYPLVPGE